MRHDTAFNEFFASAYLPHIRASKRSWILDERLATRHILPFFGNKSLGQIIRADVERWLSDLRLKGLAPSSCNRILAVLKSVFALAISMGNIAYGHSPAQDVRNFRIFNRRERYLSKEEGRRLMAFLAKINKPEASIIRLLLLTGARKSEILRARWEHLDCEKRILTVPVSKSGRPRFIYLSEEATRIFKNIPPRGGCPWVFAGMNLKKPLSDIYRFWNTIRIKLGLRDVHLHDLRHSFASYLVTDGHTLYTTQQLLGHSDPRSTMRYAHFAQDALIAATGTLDEILVKVTGAKMKKKSCADMERLYSAGVRIRSNILSVRKRKPKKL